MSICISWSPFSHSLHSFFIRCHHHSTSFVVTSLELTNRLLRYARLTLSFESISSIIRQLRPNHSPSRSSLSTHVRSYFPSSQLSQSIPHTVFLLQTLTHTVTPRLPFLEILSFHIGLPTRAKDYSLVFLLFFSIIVFRTCAINWFLSRFQSLVKYFCFHWLIDLLIDLCRWCTTFLLLLSIWSSLTLPTSRMLYNRSTDLLLDGC